MLMVTLEYLGWNPVGSSAVEGLQGRYLIPLAPLFCLIICCNRVHLVGRRFAVGWIPVASIVCLVILLRRYY
jgi:uncharacterized membrane protein